MVFGVLAPVALQQHTAYGLWSVGCVNYNQSTKRNNFCLYALPAVWLQKLKVLVADNRENCQSLSPFFTF